MTLSGDVPGPGGPPGTRRPPIGLSVAAAAARVGVATSTLRAWERRYGVGPSQRSTGGHRRYTNADIVVLQRVHRLVRSGTPTAAAAALALAPPATSRDPQGRPGYPQSGRLGSLAQQFAAASEALETRRLARVAARALRELGAIEAWTAVFAPRLRALGERWAHTGEGVEREHVSAVAVHTALTRHAERLVPARSTLLVLAAAVPDERHTLPMDALAAALAEHGVATLVLGSLPLAALHALIEDTGPAVVILWARSKTGADIASLREVVQRAPVVCAAGPGWTSAGMPKGVIHLPDLPAAVDSVLDLTRRSHTVHRDR